MAKMGLQFGLDPSSGSTCKRRFRWLFRIPEVSADGENTLPPEKSARPNLLFKEMSVKHLIEDVYYPAKPDWKPITITLYDLKREKNLIFQWVREFYRPQMGDLDLPNQRRLIKTCTLTAFDGCGVPVETWIYEDAWPQAINFQTLDMTDNNVMTADITLRYARAYVDDNGGRSITERDGEFSPSRDQQIASTA